MVNRISPIILPDNGNTSVQPFTFRDGLAFLERLERLVNFMNNVVIKFVNDGYNDLSTSFQKAINDLVNETNAIIGELEALEESGKVHEEKAEEYARIAEEAKRLAEQYASQAANAQDQTITAIFNDASSQFRELLNATYALKSESVTKSEAENFATKDDVNVKLDSSLLDLSTAKLVTQLSELQNTLDSRYARVTSEISAESFGVVADGVTDNTEALQTALDYATENGSKLVLPAGIIVSGKITSTKPVNVESNGSTIFRHNGEMRAMFHVLGGIEAGSPLTLQANSGDTTLTMQSTAGLSANDIVVLCDNFSYTTTDTNYKSGEQLRIKSVLSATVVSVYGTVRGSWSSGTGITSQNRGYTPGNGAKVRKINVVDGVKFSGITFEGVTDNASGSILVEWAKNVVIENVTIDGGGGFGIRVGSCRNVVIRGNKISDMTDDIPNNIGGYAIHVHAASENVLIEGNEIQSSRHGVTTQGSDQGFVHGMLITGNIVSECSGAAIDTHAAGEDIAIVSNQIHNTSAGINVRTKRTVIEGNAIQGTNNSFGIVVTENQAQYITIKNNDIIDCGNIGIEVRNPAGDTKIIGNVISECQGDGMRLEVSAARMIVDNNTITNVGSDRIHIRSNAYIADATPQSGGWVVTRNLLIQQTGRANAGRAIDTLSGGLTNANVINNVAVGTFNAAVFNVTAAKSSGNVSQAF